MRTHSFCRTVPAALVLVALVAVRPSAAATPSPNGSVRQLEYNRDIRPILSDKCFRCHGPDGAARQAELRLDVREAAIDERDGRRAIVPGKPEASEVVRRVASHEADERMPPADSGLTLTAAEIETLRRWIAAGAEYQPHWSLIPPQAAPLPKIDQAEWPRNEIDYFVLANLERAGLKPSPEADPATLCRRLYLDLTGLPPKPEEVDEFVRSFSSPYPLISPSSREEGEGEEEIRRGGDKEIKRAGDAYEQLVDKLLASPRFGEHMAVAWLDAARYADTNGYFSDLDRQAWRWREWVIDAYNRNLPFDQFTTWQLAGDLLPDASLEQRIATGFHRNHMVTNESGVIEEEYRTEYVVDRVDTTGTVWLGLSVGCARCHDHKYDPISQREYYQLFAFFNSSEETGLVKAGNPPPVVAVPSDEQQTELARLEAARREAEAAFVPHEKALRTEMAAWEREAAADLPSPPNSEVAAHYDFEQRLTNVAAADRYDAVAEGTIPFEPGLSGLAAKFDAGPHAEIPTDLTIAADQPFTVGVWIKADTVLGCILSKIEPDDRRRGFEVLWQKGRLQINLVDTWGSRAIETIMKSPVAGVRVWHHAVIAYDGSRRASGLRVFIDGRPVEMIVERDTLAPEANVAAPVASIANSEPWRIGRRDAGLGFYGLLDELRILRRAVAPPEAADWYWGELVRGTLAAAADKRDVRLRQKLTEYYVEHFAAPDAKAAYGALETARADEEKFRAEIPTTLVMQELPKPRATSVLLRGQYDQPGEQVSPGTPAALLPWHADWPRNRLGLARWLTSPDHPLTARTAVNRLWQHCFGEGLVRTINDFGSQGELPTHPELLDWLAVRFAHGSANGHLAASLATRVAPWDMKATIKLIVTSATYRQSSVVRPDLCRLDPENRLLARAPRHRLSAETIRDQALAVSGLLVERIGGPSVKPYQPPGLWEAVSYNGEQTYEPDQGDGLWRRSVYTFWKRQAPPPAMLSFDGPTRETCVVRRARTNTPLQALVLLNDETYVVAARGLASLALKPGNSTDKARLENAFQRATGRTPSAEELAILFQLLQRQEARFAGDPLAAEKFVAVGSSVGRARDVIGLAAWTATCQAILNLDEVITRQ